MVKIRAYLYTEEELKQKKPYTYRIKWSEHNKSYYGVRYAEGCYPEEIWTKYFTSSKFVKGFRKKYGEPDIIEVRKIFDNKNDAVKWEGKVLDRLDVCQNENWLNRAKGQGRVLGKGRYHNWYGKHLSKEHKEKLSKIFKNRKYKKITLENMSIGQKKRFENSSIWNKGICLDLNPQAKQYKLISPEGEEFIIKGIKSVEKFGLSAKSMNVNLKKGIPISMGKRKGWQLKNYEEE